MPSSHDLFVKGFLSNLTEAIDFFDSSLPKSITNLLELAKLELTKETFIDQDHKESRTDLLYKVPLKRETSIYIYLLFEHKSYYDPKIFTQLLEYLSKIYSWQLENQESLMVVIPFVFYHGERGWDLGENFLDSFPVNSIPKEFLKFLPNFAIQLLELKSKGKAFQTRNLALRLYMRMIQIIRELPEEFKIHLKEITQSIEEEYMNVLDKIREEGKLEGELKGKLEGKLEGELNKALETARKMIEKGYSDLEVRDITGLTKDQLRENGIL